MHSRMYTFGYRNSLWPVRCGTRDSESDNYLQLVDDFDFKFGLRSDCSVFGGVVADFFSNTVNTATRMKRSNIAGRNCRSDQRPILMVIYIALDPLISLGTVAVWITWRVGNSRLFMCRFPTLATSNIICKIHPYLGWCSTTDIFGGSCRKSVWMPSDLQINCDHGERINLSSHKPEVDLADPGQCCVFGGGQMIMTWTVTRLASSRKTSLLMFGDLMMVLGLCFLFPLRVEDVS